jgi:acetylglutamate kinase
MSKAILNVIKIGGNVLDDAHQLAEFVENFSAVQGPKILVHGGGKIATKLGARLGLEPKYIDGRRITDEDTLQLVTMVYGGLINKQLVAALQARGCNAIGLTGADGNIIPAKKRPAEPIDFGWVGDVKSNEIDSALLHAILQKNLAIVFAPLTHDGQGNMLNTNADTIASALAVALSSRYQVQLVYCFEKKGVLLDVEDEDSVISRINRADFLELKTGQKLHSGILPKIENALKAVESGVNKVIIGHASDLPAHTRAQSPGTTIY